MALTSTSAAVSPGRVWLAIQSRSRGVCGPIRVPATY